MPFNHSFTLTPALSRRFHVKRDDTPGEGDAVGVFLGGAPSRAAILGRLGKRSKMTLRQQHPVEALRMIRRVRIGDRRQRTDGDIGLDRGPVDEVA